MLLASLHIVLISESKEVVYEVGQCHMSRAAVWNVLNISIQFAMQTAVHGSSPVT